MGIIRNPLVCSAFTKNLQSHYARIAGKGFIMNKLIKSGLSLCVNIAELRAATGCESTSDVLNAVKSMQVLLNAAITEEKHLAQKSEKEKKAAEIAAQKAAEEAKAAESN